VGAAEHGLPLRGHGVGVLPFAEIRLAERELDQSHFLNTLLKLPLLEYRIDEKTGHYVSRIDHDWVVWRREDENTITLLTVYHDDDIDFRARG